MTMECWEFPPRYDEAYVPPADSRYWFPQRETMAQGDRDRAILQRLQEVCRYALRSKWSRPTALRAPTSRPVA